MTLGDVYDAENPWGVDDDFFLALVNRHPRSRVLDLGCGTGRLTVAIAAAGHTVTGVDPDRDALAAARDKSDRVTWIEGTSTSLDDRSFDVALMTSHVAQVFVSDDEWTSVLADVRRSLVPGGILAFDTRDPRHRPWERWTREETRAVFDLPHGGRVESWVDVRTVDDDVVTFEWANVFADGTVVDGVSALRFRSEEAVRAPVKAAGFRIEELSGSWDGQPVGADTGELIVIAAR